MSDVHLIVDWKALKGLEWVKTAQCRLIVSLVLKLYWSNEYIAYEYIKYDWWLFWIIIKRA